MDDTTKYRAVRVSNNDKSDVYETLMKQSIMKEIERKGEEQFIHDILYEQNIIGNYNKRNVVEEMFPDFKMKFLIAESLINVVDIEARRKEYERKSKEETRQLKLQKEAKKKNIMVIILIIITMLIVIIGLNYLISYRGEVNDSSINYYDYPSHRR